MTTPNPNPPATPPPGAPPPGTPPPAATPPATPPTPQWTDGFDADNMGYVQNKGFKAPGDLLLSYRNLEKLVGADPNHIIKLPQKDDAPEWAPIWERLGVPKEAKEYKVEFAKDMDPKVAENTKALFKAAGLTEKQAAAVYKGFVEQQGAANLAALEAYNQKIAQDDINLKKEWGAAYQQNIGVAQRACKALGFQPDVIQSIENAIGFAKTMQLFQGLGMKLVEDGFHRGDGGNSPGGGSGFNALTPEQAKHKITALRSDPTFTKRYLAGDVSARDEMNRLHQMANPDVQQ